MKLERGQELYSEYREGTLSPAMKLALEQHFQADPAARADYEDFARAVSLLENATFDEVEVPHGFRARIMERVSTAQTARTAERTWRERIADWFSQPNRRELTGAVAALGAIAIVAATVIHPTNVGIKTAPGTMPGITDTVQDYVTTIKGVGVENGPDGHVYHNFTVHLPENVQAASVSAYVITSTDQILDPSVRNRDATPALAAPAHLMNDQTMTIPVGLLKQAPAGATLDMLVQWKPDDPKSPEGSQVVFTPLDAIGPVDMTKTPPADGSFFDSLETIASAYHVTVIADSSNAPTASATAWTPGQPVEDALDSVAKPVGWRVVKLDPTTYLVTHHAS